MIHCTCAPDKIFSKRTFVRRLRRWWWRTAATDSEAKSAVSAFADRAPLLLSSSQFHIKVCSICRMDNFHVPLGKQMTVFIGVVRELQAGAVKDSRHSFYNRRLLTVLCVCCVCLIWCQGSLDILHTYMDNFYIRFGSSGLYRSGTRAIGRADS